MTTSQPGSRKFSPTLALLLAVIGAGSFLYYHQGLFMPRVVAVRTAEGLGNGYSFGNDYYQVWLSARELMLHRSEPYSEKITREIQTGLYGRPLDPSRPGDPIDRRVFPYPAYVDLLFWPTTEFAFPLVRIVVVGSLGLLTAASVLLWLRAFGWQLNWRWTAVILLLTLCSYPALEALFAGQLGLLVLFLFAAAIFTLQRGRGLFAGILLALATIKPQVVALPIIYLLIWGLYNWRSHGRRLALGFFSILALLVGASLAVLPKWPWTWLHTVLAYRHYTRPPLVTEVITSWLGARLAEPATLALTAIAIVTAAMFGWRARAAGLHSFQFWITLSLLVSITTIVILPGQAVYDHLILIPAIFLLVRERDTLMNAGPASKLLLAVGTVAFLWPWAAAFGLLALRPLLPSAIFDATPVFALPIRTAASLPFAVLALLVWRWKARFPAFSESA
jgi:hypothetical protein